MTTQPQVIYLKDYQAPSYRIEKTQLHFSLFEDCALVRSQLQITRLSSSNQPLVLQGHADLELEYLAINEQVLTEREYQRQGENLILEPKSERFQLVLETKIYPQKNTALEGLYKSDGIFCTQCEAEGFRRITFYPDRPDVMAVFETTIEADKSFYPVLLSNGNLIAEGETTADRHWVTWSDPHPKAAYLFALVAGDLAYIKDSFTTCSGREVDLLIYADNKDLDKLDYAMSSLKKSMAWDEQVYGREYDLDIYMIVAVDFFNMGAMENKGLNIFNTSCVLAHPKTTTDSGFQRVEAVVAHEYFHNWSGNRVTCRDWFQLSLKEGFTVFRDAEFSADMNSRTLKRIEDVILLRTAQFAEDAGPMAHPIRPESFIEISNFYTLTIYEKGAEVVRMLHTLLGADLFRKGSDLYFERHDGQAVTTEDFVQAMADVSGRDLTQFKRWYAQSGTPELTISTEYNDEQQRYSLTVKQSCPATPGQAQKQPFHIPLAMGLLTTDGTELELAKGKTNLVLEVTEVEQEFVFENISQQPIPSLLRGFSAPVKLHYAYTEAELMLLMREDTDGFARWDAAQQISLNILLDLVSKYQQQQLLELSPALIDTYANLLADKNLDKAMLARILTLPTAAYLAELMTEVDVDAIHHVRQFVRTELAMALEEKWLACYKTNQSDEAYSPVAAEVERRSLKNLALSYLLATKKQDYVELAQAQYQNADNMTDQAAALMLIVHSGIYEVATLLLEDFYQQWQDEALVVNQWFSIQASNPSENALDKVKALFEHPAFDAQNPNKLRALLAGFCMQNAVNFHRQDGQGYEFLAEQIIRLNKVNPQVASRLLTPLTRWKKYNAKRQQLMCGQLERILNSGDLSTDVYEVVSKSLALDQI